MDVGLLGMGEWQSLPDFGQGGLTFIRLTESHADME